MRGLALALRNGKVAKWISIAGHPFVFSPIVALLVGASLFGPLESVIGLVTVILCCLLPASLYILRKVRIGQWSDLDVSARKDRPQLFLIGFAFLLLTVLVLTVTGQPIIYARGCLAAMILIVGGWFLNRWLKPSMHAAFAMLTACSLWPLSAPLAVVAMLFAVAVGWSRVELSAPCLAGGRGGPGVGNLGLPVDFGLGTTTWWGEAPERPKESSRVMDDSALGATLALKARRAVGLCASSR